MNTLSIVLLSIFVPIIGIAAIVGIYILIKVIFLKKNTKYLNELESFLAFEPYIDALTALRTVDIVLKEQEKTLIHEMTIANNDEIQINDIKIEKINADKEKFATQSINIEDKLKKINDLKTELIDRLDHSRVFSCSKIIKEINDNKNDLNEIKKVVSEESKKYIDPIKDFDNKKYKLEKITYEMENLTKKWIKEINSDVFETNINDRLDKINEYLNEATNLVSNGNHDKAITYFTLFRKSLFDLVLFSNYFDKFKDILFKKASESFKKVIDYASKVKSNLSTELENLNIKTYLENVEEELSNAKKSFYNLDVKETKINLEKYFNSLLGLTFSLTQELNAYNFFTQYNIKNIKTIYTAIDEKYNELKNSCEKLLHIDKLFYWNIQNQVSELDEIKKEIDSYILQYQNNVENKEVLYSTKLLNYKKIILLFQSLINECEELEKNIDSFYTEGISQGLKYNRIKKIFINGLSDIKRFNIKLSIEDNENISLIEKKKQEIESNIINQDNYNEKDLKVYVDEFFKLMVVFIMNTLKKVLIVKSFTLICIEHGYKRINNNLFNKKVEECEGLISEGKYDDAIISLVNSIKGVSN